MTICIFSGYVAGVSHAKPDLSLLKSDDTLGLIPEPKNPFDKHAIRVVHTIVSKLGFIPREATYAIHRAKGQDLIPVVFIESVDPTAKLHQSILIRVFVDVTP